MAFLHIATYTASGFSLFFEETGIVWSLFESCFLQDVKGEDMVVSLAV